MGEALLIVFDFSKNNTTSCPCGPGTQLGRSSSRGERVAVAMELRVIGQHRGVIMMDLNTATVQDLKQAVARESGLAVEGLKLLAGAS